MTTWRPMGAHWSPHRPAEGDVVAFSHAAWRVTHVVDAIPTEDEEEWLAGYRPEERARRQPYKLTLRRLYGPASTSENSRQEIAARAPAPFGYTWHVYPSGRVPLCSCCGDPFPCRINVAESEAARQAEVMAQKMDRTMPGVCYGCGEPVTSRQRSVRYPEPNVEIPGAPAPVFHMRKRCWSEALSYETHRHGLAPLATWEGWAVESDTLT